MKKPVSETRRETIQDAEPVATSRRKLLRTAAMIGAGAPLILTLSPRAARAQGSWGRCSGHAADQGRADMYEHHATYGEGGFVIPYGHQWRKGEEAKRKAEHARKMRGY